MAKEKLNWEDEQVRHTYRHTASHIMAQAIQHLWPDTKFAIGPAIDNGFYYDMECEHKFSEEDFLKIQKEMKKLCSKTCRWSEARFPERKHFNSLKREIRTTKWN